MLHLYVLTSRIADTVATIVILVRDYPHHDLQTLRIVRWLGFETNPVPPKSLPSLTNNQPCHGTFIPFPTVFTMTCLQQKSTGRVPHMLHGGSL